MAFGNFERDHDFGATDAPMVQLKKAGVEILHIPTVLGAVDHYNLQGIPLISGAFGGIFWRN